MTLSAVRPALIHEFRDDDELLKTLRSLKETFTTRRERLGEYVHSRKSVAAYVCFYMLTNMPKVDFLLDHLPKPVVDAMGAAWTIDMGCGPGTLIWALRKRRLLAKGLYIGVDRSSLMREQFTRLREILRLDPALYRVGPEIPRNIGRECSLLSFGHSLGEMPIPYFFAAIHECRPRFIMIIEPGTPPAFQRINRLRPDLAAMGYGAVFPCPHGNLALPCPAAPDTDEWCYQVMRTVHEPALERLAQRLKMDRRIMPMIAHVYQKTGTPPGENPIRIFSRPDENKSGFAMTICRTFKETLTRTRLDTLKRHYTKDQIKTIRTLTRGDTISYREERAVGKKIRVHLTL